MRTLTPLLLRHDVLQEVDGDLLVGGQVEAHVDREQVVDFALALVLGSELFRRNLSERRPFDDLWLLETFHGKLFLY